MVEKKGFFEKVEAQVIGKAEDYVKEKVQKKLYRVGEFSVLVVLGFFLVSFGIANIVAFYFPVLSNGWSFIIFGFILLLVAYFMRI